jgi:hypothetical protein
MSVVAPISPFAVFVAIASLGCVARVPGGHGETHHLIIGFGIVTVGKTCPASVTATRTHSFGISASTAPGAKLGLGYASAMVVAVADGAEDVRAEISGLPGGALIVEAASAKLAPIASTTTTPREDGDPCIRRDLL